MSPPPPTAATHSEHTAHGPAETPPAEGRRERRKRELRQRILEAARSLFRDKGFTATTVDEIAAKADIAPATFFNHFQTKGALLALMTAEVVEHVQALLAQAFAKHDSAQRRLTDFVRTAADQIAENRGLARDVVLELVRAEARPEETAPYLARVHAPVAEMLRGGQQRREVRTDLDPAFLAQMVVGILNAAVTAWLADRDYPVETRLLEAADFAWDAVRMREPAGTGDDPEPGTISGSLRNARLTLRPPR